jgi:hypothetical protein
MSTRLDSKPQIHTLASDLGLKASDKPCQRIVQFVEARVKKIAKTFTCKSLNDLLVAVANDVGTIFREIHSDADLEKIRDEYVSKNELIFANLANDLSQADDYAITIKVHPKRPWEPGFVSVIDCRGDKKFRIYFTKWHELAHLLTLTPQMRLVFRRSHSRENSNDPEEGLMDVIASSVGFLPAFMPDNVPGELSFESISEIKKEFCPDASAQAALIGIVKAFPNPCILVQAELALKRRDAHVEPQYGFGFQSRPTPSLRAVHATVNTAARELGLQFFKNWRVPTDSIIANVFANGGYAEADEDLAWWSTSSGNCLGSHPVRVKAKRMVDGVQALLIPLTEDSKPI